MTAVVTGGGSGVGRAIALALAADHELYVLGRRRAALDETVRLIAEQGGTATAVEADVTDPASVAAAVAGVGPVDVLVNNAGYGGPASRLCDGEASVWAEVLAVNVVGPALVSAAVVPGMVERGRGHVVNVNSLQGSRAFPGFGPYGASKAALMRLTESLADELEGTGVVVFDVSPGLVRTDMTAAPTLAALLVDVPDADWTPVERAASAVAALASGRYDALHGRFLHAEDDLDAVLAALDPADPDVRRLRVQPLRPRDPLFDD